MSRNQGLNRIALACGFPPPGYMAAVAGVRHNPDLRAQYERLLGRGKAEMAALGAAMRKLVHLCFGVLKNAADYRAGATTAA
jgi:transposase